MLLISYHAGRNVFATLQMCRRNKEGTFANLPCSKVREQHDNSGASIGGTKLETLTRFALLEACTRRKGKEVGDRKTNGVLYRR
jgi:hypothetical protein